MDRTDLDEAIYDAICPEWRNAPRRGSERILRVPYREDKNPSLHINEEKGVWIDRATGLGGTAFKLAQETLGDAEARRLAKSLSRERPWMPRSRPRGRRSKGMTSEPIDLGPATPEQIAWLKADHRLSDEATAKRMDLRLVRIWGSEWIGIPTFDRSGWKLWAISSHPLLRFDSNDKLVRKNVGAASLVASPDLLVEEAAPVSRLWDVEGESDLIAAVDQGLKGLVAGTAGAGSLGGHRAHQSWLESLEPVEVVVVRDLDEAGREGANHAAEFWSDLGRPTRVLELPRDLGEGGDIRDFLLGGRGSRSGEIGSHGSVRRLIELADAAKLIPPRPARDLSAAAPELVPVSQIPRRPLHWLWLGRLPVGKLTVLDGDPGLGKSTLTADLAARVSRGKGMPDGAPCEPADVIILSAEDDVADTIRPRLEAASADLDRVHVFRAQRSQGSGPSGLIELPEDIAEIERAIRDTSARVVIIDPFVAFLGPDTNTHRDKDVRRALAPLFQAASDSGAAVLLVRHLNKAGGGNPLYRGGGSIGIIGAARCGWLLARDPDDKQSLVLASTKSNLGPRPSSLRLRLTSALQGDVARVSWMGESPHSAEDLLTDPDERSRLEEAVEFTRDALAWGGPMPSKEVLGLIRDAGISERTFQRAKRALGVRTFRDGGGPGSRVMMELPGSRKPQPYR